MVKSIASLAAIALGIQFLEYLTWAFISNDSRWIFNVMLWDRQERAGFMLFFVIVPILAAWWAFLLHKVNTYE